MDNLFVEHTANDTRCLTFNQAKEQLGRHTQQWRRNTKWTPAPGSGGVGLLLKAATDS